MEIFKKRNKSLIDGEENIHPTAVIDEGVELGSDCKLVPLYLRVVQYWEIIAWFIMR